MDIVPENEKDRISFDYDGEAREQFDVRADSNQTYLFANRKGMTTFPKLLLKLAHGNYTDGFHVHLKKDFNADNPEVLTIGLSEKPADAV